jgi:glyoxylase-like metal-dependent hydrolase (beta-lactamase superfamily II)
MRVHHLNCATMCPPLAAALNAQGRIVAHVLAIETPTGVVLVDTGLGSDDCQAARARLGQWELSLLGPSLSLGETARAQLERRGLDPRDVRDIVVTHLDLDHAGGLSDFPDATVHVLERERTTAFGPLPFWHRPRYRAAHFAHRPRWRDYRADGERWFGMPSVRVVEGAGAEIVMVPLPGHTLGHCGVAVRAGDRWLLHAGDSYFHREEIDGGPGSMMLQLFQRINAMDWTARQENLARLIALCRTGSVEIFSAHDPDEYDRLSAQAG